MTKDTKLPMSMSNLIEHVSNELHNEQRPKLANMFRECFSNTYQTTIQSLEEGSTFVITGDIPAIWLRDSSAQVRTYRFPPKMLSIMGTRKIFSFIISDLTQNHFVQLF
jgi:meiotically up-regulated gene 157 (Mug157) protein